MLRKAIWRLRIQENPSATGAPPRTPLRKLTALLLTPSWWGGAGCPLSKNPIHRSRPFGPRLFYPHSKISSDAVESWSWSWSCRSGVVLWNTVLSLSSSRWSWRMQHFSVLFNYSFSVLWMYLPQSFAFSVKNLAGENARTWHCNAVSIRA